MKLSRLYINIGLASLALVFFACDSGDPNSPGVEFMPDMYRSPSIEVYVDYANPSSISVIEPVEGTIVFTEDEEIDFGEVDNNIRAGFFEICKCGTDCK